MGFKADAMEDRLAWIVGKRDVAKRNLAFNNA